MVEVTAWLPLAVGQVAALAGVSAPPIMIMTDESPVAASAPVRARLRRCGRIEEVMSRFLLPGRGGWGGSQLSCACSARHRRDDGRGGLGGVAVVRRGEGAGLRDLGRG